MSKFTSSHAGYVGIGVKWRVFAYVIKKINLMSLPYILFSFLFKKNTKYTIYSCAIFSFIPKQSGTISPSRSYTDCNDKILYQLPEVS